MSAQVQLPAAAAPPPAAAEAQPTGGHLAGVQAHACYIDETAYGETEDEKIERLGEESGYFVDVATDYGSALGASGIRTALMMSYEFAMGCYAYDSKAAIIITKKIGAFLWYGCKVPSRGRRRTPVMDMEALLEKWTNVFVELSTAHDKDGQDRAEAQIDEMLTPLLAAPVKQLREFADRLLTTLKTDPRVPYMVWRSFEVWHEEIIAKAKDEDVKQLKTALAREIAELVELDVQPDIKDAIVNALQWRSADALQKIKQAVEGGATARARPRLRGRESCLFLEVDGHPDICVML